MALNNIDCFFLDNTEPVFCVISFCVRPVSFLPNVMSFFNCLAVLFSPVIISVRLKPSAISSSDALPKKSVRLGDLSGYILVSENTFGTNPVTGLGVGNSNGNSFGMIGMIGDIVGLGFRLGLGPFVIPGLVGDGVSGLAGDAGNGETGLGFIGLVGDLIGDFIGDCINDLLGDSTDKGLLDSNLELIGLDIILASDVLILEDVKLGLDSCSLL